ncbi:MAG: ABC transporter ATP-binding protein [Myxococcota bacterium]|nr:ABC transporter ATP-binding protein [Myxococcota bacterium]
MTRAGNAKASEVYSLRVSELSCAFSPNASPFLKRVSLELNAGTLTAVLGESGSGKSTLLRSIAGFEAHVSGEIYLGQRCLQGAHQLIPPEARKVGFVFQSPALFPHLNVFENIAFGLRSLDQASRSARVQHFASLVGIEDLLTRRTHQLSGGQQQRVALARALAPEPEIMLLDEPFSHLDRGLRALLQEQLLMPLKASERATLWVTHEPAEALAIADEIIVMRAGEVIAKGTPEALYYGATHPAAFELLGPCCWLAGEASGQSVETPIGRFSLATPWEGAGRFAFRPSQLRAERVSAGARSGESCATVCARSFYGERWRIDFLLADGRTVWCYHEGVGPQPEIGDQYELCISGHLIPAIAAGS